MTFFRELKEDLRIIKNKIRIWFLKRFTDRVKKVVIEDKETGQKREVVTERTEEKSCQHKRIEQICGTFWRCMECKDVWFEITYKVMLSPIDLMHFLETVAKEVDMKIVDQEDDEAEQAARN